MREVLHLSPWGIKLLRRKGAEGPSGSLEGLRVPRKFKLSQQSALATKKASLIFGSKSVGSRSKQVIISIDRVLVKLHFSTVSNFGLSGSRKTVTH